MTSVSAQQFDCQGAKRTSPEGWCGETKQTIQRGDVRKFEVRMDRYLDDTRNNSGTAENCNVKTHDQQKNGRPFLDGHTHGSLSKISKITTNVLLRNLAMRM